MLHVEACPVLHHFLDRDDFDLCLRNFSRFFHAQVRTHYVLTTAKIRLIIIIIIIIIIIAVVVVVVVVDVKN